MKHSELGSLVWHSRVRPHHNRTCWASVPVDRNGGISGGGLREWLSIISVMESDSTVGINHTEHLQLQVMPDNISCSAVFFGEERKVEDPQTLAEPQAAIF